MSIAVTCPCGRNVFARDEFAGKYVRCPACGDALLIPADDRLDELPPSHAFAAPRAAPSAASAPTPVATPAPTPAAISAPRTAAVGRARVPFFLAGFLTGGLVTACLAYFLVLRDSKKEDDHHPTPEAPSTYDAHIDQANSEAILGWAWDKQRPDTPIEVDICDGDTRLGTVKADLFRPDLKKEGMGDGKHGFSFPTPPQLNDGKSHSIWIKVAGKKVTKDPVPLVGAPK